MSVVRFNAHSFVNKYLEYNDSIGADDAIRIDAFLDYEKYNTSQQLFIHLCLMNIEAVSIRPGVFLQKENPVAVAALVAERLLGNTQ